MNRWFLPSFSAVLGLGLWAASWAGGRPVLGIAMFVIMLLFGSIFVFGGRSETIRGVRGDGRDERWEMIGLQGTALAGAVVITAILIGFLIELANGRDGSPYGLLAGIAGVAYIVAILVGRWRS